MKHTRPHAALWRAATIVLFSLTTSFHASPPPPGLNIWYLVKTLGSTTDVISSLADTLQPPVSTCSKKIHQIDIPYTITQPGYYCLAESVTSAATAITIASSYVTLDLNTHGVTVTTGGNYCIDNPSTAFHNISIKNGFLEGTTTVFNISSDVISFNGVVCRSANLGSTAVGTLNSTVNGFTITNCTFYSTSLSVNGSTNGLITNSLFQSMSPADSTPGISLQLASDIVVSNCVVSQYGGVGVLVSAGGNISVLNSYAFGNGLSGFAVSAGAVGLTLGGCTFQNCYSLLNGFNGFDLNFSVITVVSTINVKGCVAAYNTNNGFNINGAPLNLALFTGAIIECVALNNANVGFNASNLSLTSLNTFNNAAHNNTTNFTGLLPLTAIVIHPVVTDDYWVNVAAAA